MSWAPGPTVRTHASTGRQMVGVGVIASALGIAAGLLINWFPVSASEEAKPIDTLWDVLIIFSVPVFVGVTVVVPVLGVEVPDASGRREPRSSRMRIRAAACSNDAAVIVVHYNRDGGEVVVSGSAEDTLPHEWKACTALITISDTGTGIPAGEAERVFDRFYRLDQSRARRTGGSGLGLASVARC